MVDYATNIITIYYKPYYEKGLGQPKIVRFLSTQTKKKPNLFFVPHLNGGFISASTLCKVNMQTERVSEQSRKTSTKADYWVRL